MHTHRISRRHTVTVTGSPFRRFRDLSSFSAVARKGWRALASGLLAAAVGSAAYADEAKIRAELPTKMPNLAEIKSVTKTPVKNLYEVVLAGADVVYVTGDSRHILVGNLIDADKGISLTDPLMEEFGKTLFDWLDFSGSFKIVRGNGKRHMAVFEDPNCGYCKRYEKELKTIDDVTVHVFLVPMLGNDSAAKSVNIWCAKDKGKAWLDWMTENIQPPQASKTCDTSALSRNLEFAHNHNIRGVPMTLFSDSTRVGGIISMDRVRKHLKDAEAARKQQQKDSKKSRLNPAADD